jgi:hypothetical protein
MNGTIICNKWEQSENSVNFEEIEDRCLAFRQLCRDSFAEISATLYYCHWFRNVVPLAITNVSKYKAHFESSC